MTDPGLPLTNPPDRSQVTGEGNTDGRIVAEGDVPKVEPTRQYFTELRASLKNALDASRDLDDSVEDLRYSLASAEAECGRLREREQAAHGEGYDQGAGDVWSAPVCSVCGANHDADESAMCERGEVVSFREWVEAAGRLREQLAESEAANESYAVEATMAREQLDAARQNLENEYLSRAYWAERAEKAEALVSALRQRTPETRGGGA